VILINPRTSKKRNVYLVDLGTGTTRNLLPLSIGLIASYSNNNSDIKANYDIHLNFLRSKPEDFVATLQDPVVVGFACYQWNFKASLKLANFIKRQFPSCLIVLGSYSVPHIPSHVEDFMKAHPFVDVLVHDEGELSFSEILLALLEGRSFSKVEGISYRSIEVPSGYITSEKRNEFIDLNDTPSPFLNGLYDQLMDKYKKSVTGVVWETSRGCPYACTFCGWGKTDGRKIRKVDLDRLLEELEWMSKNEIYYVTSSDANFGIFYERDLTIIEKVASLCEKTGYPGYLTWSWQKNTNEKTVHMADLLRRSGVKSSTLISIQSFSPVVAKAIKRYNMSDNRLEYIEGLYKEKNLPVLKELILGLPEETLDSFCDGLERVMTESLVDRYRVYLCCIIESSEMADPAYLEKYKIETRKVSLGMERIRFDPLADEEVEEVVVATSTMSSKEWVKAYILSFLTISLYNLPLIFFVVNYLCREFKVSRIEFIEFLVKEASEAPGLYPVIERGVNHLRRLTDSILANKSKLMATEQLGDEPTTPTDGLAAIFLEHGDKFYLDIKNITKKFCSNNNISLEESILEELVLYQKVRIPTWPIPKQTTHCFRYNFPEYFDRFLKGEKPISLNDREMTLEVLIPNNIPQDPIEFAQKRVIGSYILELYEVRHDAMNELKSESGIEALIH
jgi:radical SAM superfamily enzyme YgiQ (UPF0313 family)